MFKLLRRISGSVTGRLDREWNDDATSNAPQTGRKRRISDDDEDTSTLSKRSRSLPVAVAEEGTTPERDSPPAPTKETEDVRQVTKGVGEVELDDGGAEALQTQEAPVPNGISGAEDATPPPAPLARDNEIAAASQGDTPPPETQEAAESGASTTLADDASPGKEQDTPSAEKTASSEARSDDEVPPTTQGLRVKDVSDKDSEASSSPADSETNAPGTVSEEPGDAP